MSDELLREKHQQYGSQVLQLLWYLLLLGVTLFIVMPHPTQAFVALFTEEAIIVEQTTYPGGCVDESSWTSTSGACDLIVCYVEPSGPYIVTHSCRPREDYENPDSDNCQWVSNTTQAFPDCCPKLQCASSTPITEANSTVCEDIASTFACGIWKNLTSGCSDPTSTVYNITQTYCNNTCGLC